MDTHGTSPFTYGWCTSPPSKKCFGSSNWNAPASAQTAEPNGFVLLRPSPWQRKSQAWTYGGDGLGFLKSVSPRCEITLVYMQGPTHPSKCPHWLIFVWTTVRIGHAPRLLFRLWNQGSPLAVCPICFWVSWSYEFQEWVHVPMHTHTYLDTWIIYIDTYVYICIHIDIYICIYTYMYTCVHVYIYMYTCGFPCICEHFAFAAHPSVPVSTCLSNSVSKDYDQQIVARSTWMVTYT